ncbi:hypothetical protein VTN02DRAFT_1776 [Thermoascus thermophilus]
MADILPRLLSFSPRLQASQGISDEDYDDQIRNLVTYLKQTFSGKVIGSISDNEDLLEHLDPSLHSLSYLFIHHSCVLAVQSRTKETFPEDVQPGGRLWSKALLFLKEFDPVQVRYAGQEWRRLVELVAKAAEAVSKPLLAVQPIRDAMLRLDPSGSSFTSTHVLLNRLCLHARAYAVALPIIDKDICHFSTGSDQVYLKRSRPLLCSQHQTSATFITHASGFSAKLSYRDHLQYFLYGSMIYMGLKQWGKALHFLSVVISAPCVNSVSMIMVEAYKKWVLVSLLERGAPIPLPNATSPQAAKVYRSLARPYDALGEAFKSGDFDRLRAEVDVGQSIWHMDKNTGLVLQVLVAFRKYSVLRLGSTFAALTIADVAHRTSPDPPDVEETEMFVASLIMSRTLDATLLHSNYGKCPTMLRFSAAASSTDASLEASIRNQLIQERRRLMLLMVNVEESDRKLELSKEHVDHLRRSQKRKDNTVKNGGPNVVRDGNDFDVDEDMMGDLQ